MQAVQVVHGARPLVLPHQARLALRHLDRLLVALAHLVAPLARHLREAERARWLTDGRVVGRDALLGLEKVRW
mgnify:CR=1 FL=1